MELRDIANKVNVSYDSLDITPELIDPIIKYLLNHEADDVLESYQRYLDGVKVKFCDVCGEKFVESKKVTGQTTCKTCRKKYKSTEIIVLKGYRTGKYNEKTAIYAYNLREAGLTNKEIAEELKIPNSLVTPIIDLLLPKEFDGEDNDKVDDFKGDIPKKICRYCGEKFSPESSSSNDIFCSDCNKKYDYLDLLLFIRIKEGKYSFKTATEIFKSRKSGVSDEVISEKLHIPKDLINPILKQFGFRGEEIDSSNNLNHCSVCGNLFVMVKGSSNQQYCLDCKRDYKNHQLRVLVGINEGIYTKNMAIKIHNLLERGESKSSIAKKFKISTAIIDPIVEYLYEDQMPDFMNNFSITSNLRNNLLITSCSGNKTNFKLKGIIHNQLAVDFINILSKINLSIKEIIFKEKERGMEFSLNFDVEDSYLDTLFSELINIGFE